MPHNKMPSNTHRKRRDFINMFTSIGFVAD
jgi:hypothetical protein